MAYVGKKPEPLYLGQVDDLNVQGDAAVTGNLTVTGTTITMDSASVQTVDLGDNDKIRLGDADDAQIYHDGTNTIINNDTGNIGITGSNVAIDGTTLFVDASTNHVGINTDAPSAELEVVGNYESSGSITIGGNILATSGYIRSGDGSAAVPSIQPGVDADTGFFRPVTNTIGFATAGTEQARLNSGGDFLINKTGVSLSGDGHVFTKEGTVYHTNTDLTSVMYINRAGTDGNLVRFYAQGNLEGFIGVSGSTVTYSGGHLARWAQLPSNTKDESIVKGTVMTNLDEMCIWEHEAVEAQDAVYDEEGNVITEAVEAKDAYIEDNEQLNKMAVSSVEGDPNVAGVFVNWEEDDDDFNDMNIAMTGDMVIRIAEGTTVQRGDLLMSAGDGTAKPQEDDIVRSKTIAKVTSTHVSHIYDDGSYLVPCVLMAC